MREAQARVLSDDERRDWLRLIRSQSVGPITFHKLLERFGPAAAALDAYTRALPGITASDPRLIRPFKRPADQERFLEGLRKAGLPA